MQEEKELCIRPNNCTRGYPYNVTHTKLEQPIDSCQKWDRCYQYDCLAMEYMDNTTLQTNVTYEDLHPCQLWELVGLHDPENEWNMIFLKKYCCGGAGNGGGGGNGGGNSGGGNGNGGSGVGNGGSSGGGNGGGNSGGGNGNGGSS